MKCAARLQACFSQFVKTLFISMRSLQRESHLPGMHVWKQKIQEMFWIDVSDGLIARAVCACESTRGPGGGEGAGGRLQW